MRNADFRNGASDFQAENRSRWLQICQKACEKGFPVDNLKNIRQLYKVYSTDQIRETAFTQFGNLPAVSTGRKISLSWFHYLKLMRV